MNALIRPSLLALACAACVDSTGGERVRFAAQVESVLAATAGPSGDPVLTWHDPVGRWTLHEATVRVGPIYLWSDEPRLDPGALGVLRRGLRTLADAALPIAHAQAVDQFEAGFLRGEVTTQIAVDLTEGGPWHLGTGEGIGGPVRSGELWLEPSRQGPTLRLAGTLEPERDDDDTDLEHGATLGDPVPFAIALTITPEWVPGADASKPVLLRRVRGLLLDGTLAEDASLTLQVDPSRWLQGLVADDLREAPTDDGVHTLTPDTRAGLRVASLLRRTGSASGWSLHLSQGSRP